MNDIAITCIDCNQPFSFTKGEQEYFAARDFSTPKRCPQCRAARKDDKKLGIFRARGQDDTVPRLR